MLNQIVLVGRLVEDLKLEELENGKKITNLILAIPRNFKNADGEYDTDFIECVLWNGIAENATEYCKKGDIVGIRGRLENNSFENEDGSKVYKAQVIAEKVTFLSSKKEEEKGE